MRAARTISGDQARTETDFRGSSAYTGRTCPGLHRKSDSERSGAQNSRGGDAHRSQVRAAPTAVGGSSARQDQLRVVDAETGRDRNLAVALL